MDRSKEARQARKLQRLGKANNGPANYKARKSRDVAKTWGIVGVVTAISVGLISWAVIVDRAERAEQANPSATPTPEVQTEVKPDDPSVPAGEAKAFESPAIVADTPIACEGEQPENAAATRNIYPGGPKDVLGDTDWVAEIATSCGTIVVDLLEKDTPKTVNSFAFLGQNDFFNGLEIFRNATTIGALQTGSGTNEATWGIGYNLPDELGVAQQGYFPGDVAMANSGPNSGGSQFFFVYNDKFQLPPNYATFGRVISGMDVLEKIGAIPAGGESGETPTERVYMNTVTVRAATEEEQGLAKAAAEERAKASPVDGSKPATEAPLPGEGVQPAETVSPEPAATPTAEGSELPPAPQPDKPKN